MENAIQVRPELNSEIQAQIKSLGEITSNFLTVKEKALEIKEYYSQIIYDENSLKVAKEDKAEINKYKKSVSQYRIGLKKEFEKPFEEFETLAKETEAILDDTAKMIAKQIDVHEDVKRNEKIETMKSYFDEYAQSLRIDFITYDRMDLKVNLSDSDKKLQGQIKDWLDNISSDLQLITTQTYADEIYIEYKESLDVKSAITRVNMRKEMLRANQNIEQSQKKFTEDFEKFTQPIEETITKPVEEVVENEEIKQTTFIVKGTMSQLINLKNYIESNGMEIVK